MIQQDVKTPELGQRPSLKCPQRDSSQSNQLGRFALPPHSVPIGVALTFLGALGLCLRNYWVFSVPVHEDGDLAANSILINQAVHFTLLVGNYSREHFNHPGPAYFYIQSIGQDIFYSMLHVVPSPFNGQLIAVFALNSAMFVLATMIIFRHVRSWPVAVIAMSAVLIVTGGSLNLNWASSWMPHLYIAPFLLATIAGVSVAVGALQDLPSFTFAVCLLIHGHVSFIGIMGTYILIVAFGWLVTQRHISRYRLLLSEARWFLLMSFCIVTIFAIPMLLDLLLHWPGQWSSYWKYSHSNSQLHPHAFAQVAAYVEQFWPGGHAAKILVLVAGLVTALLALFDPIRIRRTFVLGLLIAVGVLSLEVAVYAWKGVDYLNLTYAADFYFVLPPLLVALLWVELAWRVRSLSSRLRREWLVRVVPAVVVMLALAGLVLSLLQGSAYNAYRGDPSLSRMAAVIKSDPGRENKGVAISLEAPGDPAADWPDVVGLLVAASRDGYRPCIANASWKFMMSAQYICSAAHSGHRFSVAVQTTMCPIPDSARQVFRSGLMEAYAAPAPVTDPCPPSSTIGTPASGATLNGSRFLSAGTTAFFGVIKVEFEVSGEGLRNVVVSKASPYIYGWIGAWNTATVSNGLYTLRSVVYDGAGHVERSPGISVVVKN